MPQLLIPYFFFFNDPAPPEISTLSLPDPLPIWALDSALDRVALASSSRIDVDDALRRVVERRDAPGDADVVPIQLAARNGAAVSRTGAVQPEIGRAHV